MNPQDLNYYYNRFKFGEDNFHNLMSFRIRKILLVATFYDAYTIEHDGRLIEQITGDYFRLNLTTVPRISSVPTGDDALALLKEEHFDLVITTLRTGSTDPFDLAGQIHALIPDIPVLLLLTVKSDMELVRKNSSRMAHIENVYLWNGDSRLFVAMIKNVEDRRNADFDTEHGFVRVILLVEDSVDFYSRYLPLIYQEIMEQTQKLIREELNENLKYHLMRTRPKILLVNSCEKALEVSRRFAPYLLAVLSDVRFYRNGEIDPEAGIHLIRQLKKEFADVPMLLQSSRDMTARAAEELGVEFINKHSVDLLARLRRFIVTKLGFGDFIFRDSRGREIAKASSLAQMEEVILQVPIESIAHHANLNHFSAWLVAHGEFQVARNLRPVKVSDFSHPEDHRSYLIRAFQEARANRLRGNIVAFDPSVVKALETVLRLREGSLGGKGRGLAFCNALLVSTELNKDFDRADIRIPRTMILGTDEYDRFLEKNRILSRIEGKRDERILQIFLEGELDEQTYRSLEKYLEVIKQPLAVRSSSLLEDSHAQPFAGVYDTVMIPNSSSDLSLRVKQLCRGIKQVYASVFREETRKFIASHGYRLDEEKMGVLIQELTGQKRGDLFYPHISGVAQSFNYYPPQGLTHEQPIASLAVGLGKTVVEGGRVFRYCPSHPEIPCQTLTELVRYTQTEFYALNTRKGCVEKMNVSRAESDGVLRSLASVMHEGNMEEGLFYDGPRIVNFPDIIRYEAFPLSSILQRLLVLLEGALGCPAEIEFAVDLDGAALPVFSLLQVRPMTSSLGINEGTIPDEAVKKALVYSENSLGHGIRDDLYDLIYIPPEGFDKTETLKIQEELKQINRTMKEQERKYILLGPGRWGSSDRFLGIPVTWPQIDQAAIIVEAAVRDLMTEPSQGSHFFHNLTAGGVGYFMVREGDGRSVLDWDKLNSLPLVREGTYIRHVRSETPFRVVMNGNKGVALIGMET